MARVELTFEQSTLFDKFLIYRTEEDFDFNAMPEPIGESLLESFTDTNAPDETYVKYCVASQRGSIKKYSEVLTVNTGAIEAEVIFAGIGNYYVSTNTWVSVKYPTGIQTGDLIILHIASSEDYAPVSINGFTQVPTNANHSRVYYKVADGSESGNLAFAWSNQKPAAIMTLWRASVASLVVGIESQTITSHSPQPENIQTYFEAPIVSATAMQAEIITISGIISSADSQVNNANYIKLTDSVTSMRFGIFYKKGSEIEAVAIRRQNAPIGNYEHYRVSRIILKIE
ncbi:hypothetical protein [Acinetobacter radioresistens]|uniref:hypothetical protein n=1 Tax=Acinetobacter radioresistens TaxID=40216 RepID=UPI000C31E3A6|nr:hypothetical protein [Acinetobacter radioresistens]PKD80259.1 hypothetical protein CW313_13800 [Acinetobacter radioresistens]